MKLIMPKTYLDPQRIVTSLFFLAGSIQGGETGKRGAFISSPGGCRSARWLFPANMMRHIPFSPGARKDK